MVDRCTQRGDVLKEKTLLCYGNAFKGISLSSWRKTQLQINSAVLLTDHLYSVIKHHYPHWRGLHQNTPAPIHRTQGLGECFDEYNNNVHLPHPSQSLDLNAALMFFL